MQRLEVSGAVRPIYGSLGVKRLRHIFWLYRWDPMVYICLLCVLKIYKLLDCVETVQSNKKMKNK